MNHVGQEIRVRPFQSLDRIVAQEFPVKGLAFARQKMLLHNRPARVFGRDVHHARHPIWGDNKPRIELLCQNNIGQRHGKRPFSEAWRRHGLGEGGNE